MDLTKRVVMSKYIKIYEQLCPDDPIAKDDPRRSAIINEMQQVCTAKTDERASRYIEWWSVWRNDRAKGKPDALMDFVRKARKLYGHN